MPTNTAPQSVSRRYAHSLLCRGSNRTYEIHEISQQIARTPSGIPCGFYFVAYIKRTSTSERVAGEGITPVEAVVAALVSLGVTFQ